MRKTLASIFLVTFSLVSFLGCDDNDSVSPDIQETEESKISFSVKTFPDIGSTETIFRISTSDFSDATNLSKFKFRYDFNDDGTFDTEWLDSASVSHQYTAAGEKKIKVELKDHEEKLKSVNYQLFVGQLELVQGLNSQINHNEPNYAKDGSNRIVFSLMDKSSHQLFIADLSSGSVMQLTTGDPNTNNCKHVPDWSTDGKTIAVDHVDGTYLVDAITGDLTKISDIIPIYLEHSPDGKNLLIVKNENNGEVYISNLETKTEKLFLQNTRAACWSPDSKQIAVIDHPNKLVKILDAETGNVVKQYENEYTEEIGARDNYMDWSADGKWIHMCMYQSMLNTESGKVYKIAPGNFKRKSWAESSMNSDANAIAFTNSKIDDPVDQIYILKLPSELK